MFIAPPSMEELEKRLRARGTETEESIQKRLHNAKKELEYIQKEGFWDIILQNDDLDQTYEKFKQWILKQ